MQEFTNGDSILRLALGIDTETTGVKDADQEKIIEIGLCLFDLVSKKPLWMQSFLVLEDGLNSLSKEIESITGIFFNELKSLGQTAQKSISKIEEILNYPIEMIVAHNAEFDKRMLKAFYSRNNPGLQSELFQIPWLCTQEDIPYPENQKSKALNYLACDHGFLNPFKHRALTDILTMLKVIEGYDLLSLKEKILSPKVKIKAKVSFDQKDKAKEKGFRWDDKRRVWWKYLRQTQVEQEAKSYEFSIEVLPD